MSMDEAIDTTMRIARAAREVREDVFVICHGGDLLITPENVAKAMKQMPGINGFTVLRVWNDCRWKPQ